MTFSDESLMSNCDVPMVCLGTIATESLHSHSQLFNSRRRLPLLRFKAIGTHPTTHLTIHIHPT